MFCFNCGYNLEEVGLGIWECPRCENQFLPYKEEGDQCLRMMNKESKESEEEIMFKNLTDEEEREYRQWAREHYQAGDQIKKVWHPVVQDECEKINEEYKESYPVDYELSENQKQFVRDARKQGFEIRWSYSGRGMYGRECPGIVQESDGGGIITNAEVSVDNMGKDYIVYAEK